MQFIGVDVRGLATQARSFMKEFGMTLPERLRRPGRDQDPRGLFGQPVTAFFERRRERRVRVHGPIADSTFRPTSRRSPRPDPRVSAAPLVASIGPMAAVCDICGKKPWFGKSVTFSHKRNNRRWDPNIQRVRALVDGTPTRERVHQLHQGRQGRRAARG